MLSSSAAKKVADEGFNSGAMESMDRDQAFAFLGLSDDATPDDVQSRVDARRRQLELRLRAAVSPDQRRLLERALTDLEDIRALAMLDPRDPAAGLPGGAWIALKSGTLLGDRYVIKNRLGNGERGAVFRALDLTWGRDVAVKVLLPEMLLVPGTMDRLAAILRRQLAFAHDGIASIYSLGRAGGTTFIVTELVEGETLRQHATRLGGKLTPSGIERLIAPICSALSYAAERMPHLNLKLENVLVASDGTIKLTDFGLEDVIPTIPRGKSRAMAEQRRFRTPEQVRRARNVVVNPEAVDERADQFGVAALAYFLATGEPPAADATDLAHKRPDLPAAMAAAVRRGLSSEPDTRFATLDQMRKAMFSGRVWLARRAVLIGAGVLLALATATATVIAVKPDLLSQSREIVPHDDALAAQQQATALHQRTTALKTRLEVAERTLRTRLREARLAVDMREAVGIAPQDLSLADARATRDMLETINAFAMPQVFNNPELLNAYNVLNVSSDAMESRRFREVVGVLSGVEAIMSARLADLREAERLARERFGVNGAAMLAVVDAKGAAPAWEATVAERRRFASAVDQGLVLIPARVFSMGDTVGGGNHAEQPVHRVSVSAFKIGRAPVTRAEFALCAASGECRDGLIAADGDMRLPMTGVSWHDAQDYTAWLRARSGEDYRLPSEAEWEYAARAGMTTDYPWGNAVGRNHANCAGCGSAWEGVGPAPVASFPANAFGLHDVVGNVWQWTADCWYRDFSSAPATGEARDEVACQSRVLRGGSWDNDAWMSRLSYRGGAPATLRQDINGFRIAKSVD